MIQYRLLAVYLIWGNPFFYLFIASMILFFIIIFHVMKLLKNKVNEIKLMQQQHVAKIDVIRKEQSDILDKIRIEILKKEDERVRQWIESEKETLHVLNGVSTLFDLSKKVNSDESKKILNKLDEIRYKIEKIIPKE